MTTGDILSALTPVVDAFDRHGIRYVVCGSVSSLAHGVPRATADVDVLAELRLEHAEVLADELQSEYYIDGEAVADAVRMKSSFNAIHMPTVYKIDIFVPFGSAFDDQVMKRALPMALADNSAIRSFNVQSPEDTVLSKLRWYRLGREVSQRQISDVLGVLRVQQSGLDLAYLRHWSAVLKVGDLLAKCLAQVGQE